jgi:putative FmdB family regulatory protein
MPTYEYECSKCHKHFTVIKSIAEHERKRPTCPKCKSRKVEQVLTPFYAKTVKKS